MRRVRMANEMGIDGLFDVGVLACLFAYKPDAFRGDRLGNTVSGKKPGLQPIELPLVSEQGQEVR